MNFSLHISHIPKQCNYCSKYHNKYFYVYKTDDDFFNRKRLLLCLKCVNELYSKKDKKQFFN